MIEINESKDIIAQLKANGRTVYHDTPESVAAIVEMNEQLDAVRKEFQIKDRNSQLNACEVILTA